jgi:hypothetical protein
MASTLTHRAKLVAYALSRRADWATGDNCHLSDDTIVKYAGLLRPGTNDPAECQKNTGRQCWTCDRCKAEHAARKTARRGREDLESAGFIERTGRTTIKNVISYRLRFPWDSRVPTEAGQMGHQSPADGTPESQLTAARWDSRVPTEAGHMGQQSPADGTTESSRWDTKVPQPPFTSSDLEVEEEEEEDFAALVRSILPDSWTGTGQIIDAGNSKLRLVLSELKAAGWDASRLRQVCRAMPQPKKNPTALLVKHLQLQLASRPEDLVHVNPVLGRCCGHDIPVGEYCYDCREAPAPSPQPAQAPWEVAV